MINHVFFTDAYLRFLIKYPFKISIFHPRHEFRWKFFGGKLYLFGDSPRCIVGYTVRNLFLWRPASRAVKRDFWPYVRQYTIPNEMFWIWLSPFLVHCCSFVSNWCVASHIKPQSSKEMWRNQWRQPISDSISQDILPQSLKWNYNYFVLFYT